MLEKWNETVTSTKKVIEPIVHEKTQEVIVEFDLPEVFIDTVEWDILHIALEAEFSNFVPPAFYASQAYWYVKGHFPCGWQGEFPNGTLIIY